MAEPATLARPYAEAVYRLATESGTLAQWSAMLAFLATVVADERVRDLIENPHLDPERRQAFIGALGEKALDAHGRELVRVLFENGRLWLAPAILVAFEALKAEAAGSLEANIASAFPLSDAQLAMLAGSMARRFGRRIEPKVEVDPELIGGVTITVGDQIFDASVRGKLKAMAFALKR
ncbi:MAG: F0F1 ATP synthase subunit delta [Betaproteobacteria bacterium]|nr:F0F1 ATP synthase subunit delta [Betaproteobacteria bacterium]